MKKIIPYILILITILQLFAPFSLGLTSKNNISITANRAEADGIVIANNVYVSDKTVSGRVRIAWESYSFATVGEKVIVILIDPTTGAILDKQPVKLTDAPKSTWTASETNSQNVQTGTYTFPHSGGIEILPSTAYKVEIIARQEVTDWSSLLSTSDTPSGATTSTPLTVTTLATGNSVEILAGSQTAINDDAMLPLCEWTNADTWGGCFGRGVYWLFFKPTSYLFALTGRLLDVSIDYSTKDTSYRSPFVVEGWGVVRDFCNMFFIFVLIYIAFGTILSLHSFKTKEMIVNVVIIGLLINFSLFATQIIIDASNILTRVFYNTQSIVVGPKVNGVVQSQVGSMGEIKISEALVAKINPQKLILEAYKADKIETRLTVGTSNGKTTNNVSASTFILVSILATIVNIVGLFTFLTCALIFISRVIGLWLAMIFAPLAFFSYTVPGLQDMDTIGWKKWWPETIKLAFLAPVFIFFLYLIIKFLESGLGLTINDESNGMNFILGIFVPFIFIMILLTKAKDIANKMSGTIGQSITGGMKAAAGIALGGAALGTAMLGRSTLGAISKSVQNDGARKKDLQLGSNVKDAWKGAGLNPFKWVGAIGKNIKSVGKAGVAGVATGVHAIPVKKKDAQGNVVNTTLGKHMQESEKGFNEKGHAVHELDNKTSEMADELNVSKETTFKELTEPQQTIVKESIDKDIISKELYNEKFSELKDINEIDSVKDAFSGRTYNNDETMNYQASVIRRDPNDPEKFERKNVTNNNVKAADTFAALSKTNPVIGEFVQALRKGSYDIRNISQLKTKSKGFPVMGVGLIAAVAGGVRLGLKNGPNVEPGTGKKDFMLDLKDTVSGALKSMKIDVKVDNHSSPGGGGAGHGAASHH